MEQNLYLVHHGIKGQRWGVRRYQNPDGSLTAEGRTHYLNQARKHGFASVQNATFQARAHANKGTMGAIGAASGVAAGLKIGNPLLGLGIGAAAGAVGYGITAGEERIFKHLSANNMRKFQEAVDILHERGMDSDKEALSKIVQDIINFG